jgi:HEPN domain-containing protein
MDKDLLINNFAIRSFRETADYDYISARMTYRARLIPQFHWASLQAIEKYLKCILLLNRIKATSLRHDLSAALNLIKRQAPFELRLQESSEKFIEHLDTYGRFRYLETPFHVLGLELIQLDKAVWDIRRYCRVLNYEIRLSNGEMKSMLDIELEGIASSETKPPQSFSIMGGELEKIIANKKHPARKPLLWQNLYFGQRHRKHIQLERYFHATNSPLSLHPEILEDVLNYIFLPKDVQEAYRNELLKLKGNDI